MLVIIDGDQTHSIDITYDDLMKAIVDLKKERDRQRLKSARRYQPTGRNPGRPKKSEIKIDGENIYTPGSEFKE